MIAYENNRPIDSLHIKVCMATMSSMFIPPFASLSADSFSTFFLLRRRDFDSETVWFPWSSETALVLLAPGA